MEKFGCIFGFSVKSYVRNTINLSCTKIMLASVINKYLCMAKRSLLSERSSYYYT